MKRHTKSPVLDISIREDRLEHDRIQLEHNLQHTDLSLHLSSNDDDPSIEYPRHNSAPSPFPDFISFPRHDHDNIDPSQLHAWSYRTGDDEDGISPYGGETVSTAAHHASALTLNAGLGGRAARREISLSGAEYDPDRPLHDMMAAVDPKLSMFDMDPSRSRYEPPYGTPAQLDRVLRSGHAPSSRSRSVRIRSPHSSSTSSDSETPRSRLADALQRVALSPKRPRSPQTSHQPNHRHAQVPPSPLTRAVKADDSNLSTPRPSRRSTSASTPASQFTRAARGLTRDLVEQQQAERNPFSDIANRDGSHHNKSRVYLPDVTGLTSAVESPAKAGGAYGAYAPHDDRPRDSEARLLSVLSVVQAKLHQLEDENSISRRRVRELELELEACKREVVKERTRVLEMEEEVSVYGKGKGKAPDPSLEDVEERYREVVEEKKALESLISTLRTHLTRLTSELSAHQELLTELRQLREKDARTLKEKSGEVERLRREVERLGGEVEVLRGVVEEGLRERRAAREEVSESQSAADVAMSADLEESEEEEELLPDEEDVEEPLDDRSRSSLSLESDEEDEESEAEPFDPVSILGSSRAGANGVSAPDRTLRTDHATRGSPSPSGRFGGMGFGEDELARIGRDVEERRSNLSGGSSARENSPQTRNRRAAMVEEVSDAGTEVPRVPSPSRPPPAPHRPAGPTPARARQSRPSNNAVTPFPQIRGEHLERLFFSAPPHNARTCTVCCRRRGRGSEPQSWVERDFRAERKEDDDEGFVDGEPDEAEAERERERARKRLRTILGKSDGRQREDRDYEATARKAGLPPQTIVARVIRELEDDFTHYKSVYVELADQYKEMDAVSDVPKRNMLAKHLREVVDILEQKGDQIASLYDCLTFKDKPLAGKR